MFPVMCMSAFTRMRQSTICRGQKLCWKLRRKSWEEALFPLPASACLLLSIHRAPVTHDSCAHWQLGMCESRNFDSQSQGGS